MRHLVVIAMAAVLLLGGCSTITLVDGGRQAVAGSYSVDPQVPWSRIKHGEVEVWTVDGPLLQALRFVPPREDGDLLDPFADSDGEGPRFRAGMTASEVSEMVADTLSTGGFTAVTVSGLRPFDFGGRSGFRFEMALRSSEGLELAASVAGVEVDERLLVILYSGARAHYYPKMLPAVDALLASLRLGG